MFAPLQTRNLMDNSWDKMRLNPRFQRSKILLIGNENPTLLDVHSQPRPTLNAKGSPFTFVAHSQRPCCYSIHAYPGIAHGSHWISNQPGRMAMALALKTAKGPGSATRLRVLRCSLARFLGKFGLSDSCKNEVVLLQPLQKGKRSKLIARLL